MYQNYELTVIYDFSLFEPKRLICLSRIECKSFVHCNFSCNPRLEAEIEAARFKAKEEMMQGIQVAKEMAQKELISQKQVYEDRIKTLEQELVCDISVCD